MITRPAMDSDIPALHRIYTSDAVSPYVAFDRVDEAGFERVFRGWQSGGEVMVAERESGVVGAYVLQRRAHRLAHTAYIGSVAVDPTLQGQGIGTAMMRDAIERLHSEGRHRIELLVSADNPRAIAMYARLGFVVEGTHRRFFRRAGETAYIDEHSMALLRPAPGEDDVERHGAATDAGGSSGSRGPRPIDRDSGAHYVWGDACDGWHLVRTAQLSVIEERMPAGTAETRHYHGAARQFFYVRTGSLTMEIGAESHVLGPGQGIEVPPGLPHRARNGSDEPTEFLVISSPPSHGDRHEPSA